MKAFLWSAVGVFGMAAALTVMWVKFPAGIKAPAEVLSVPNAASSHALSPDTGAVDGEAAVKRAAIAYAQAVQAGDGEKIVGMTLWMRERVDRVAAGPDGPSARENVAGELIQSATSRPVEGNQLRPEGIEDKYVFAPGAQLEMTGTDVGRPDLERQTHERTWIRVTYPRKELAPRNADGHAIRALSVGVNVSAEGYVLKAGVIGNLDIDHDSVSLEWDQ